MAIEPETSVVPSTLSATQVTQSVCPFSVRSHAPDAMDHTLQRQGGGCAHMAVQRT